MSRMRNWMLTLGIMAAAPGITVAGPFSFLGFGSKPTPQPTATKSGNQKVAENIASALRSAKLTGYEIEIEFDKGVATLSGMIGNARQKAKAQEVISRIPGVRTVDNRLQLIQASAVEAANLQDNKRSPIPFLQQTGGESSAPGALPSMNGAQPAASSMIQGNQVVASKIAGVLSNASLNGYDIEIRYQNGTALLNGSVANPGEWTKASQLVQSLPEVQRVDNRLQVRNGQAPQMRGPAPGFPMAPIAAGFRQGPGQPPQAAGGAGMPAPTQFGHPGSGITAAVANSPQLPDYAWPSYASYPNYAQLSYPKQYSASAWPYIGPFYPYPQVPLGWRTAQLAWDDGQWSLNFNSRTDKWYWFVNPKNW